jgi:parallel beta-helix repeat protein
MVASTSAKIVGSRFRNTRLDAIAGSRVGSRIATTALIEDNDIVGSGIPADPEAPATLPAPARAAIHAGQYATVRHNRIDRTAYVGIRADRESLIEKNHIQNSCLLLDDGGGIYVKDTNNNGRIASNIIEDVWGNTDGKPAGSVTQTAGIYLDDWTSGIEVSGNTVRNADHGIHVHNAFSNTISGNTFFGNRTNQIWMQENAVRLDPLGDIHSNVISGNHIVPVGVENSIYQVSEYAKPSRFASYIGNVFSTLFSPIVAVDTWKESSGAWQTTTYGLEQWLSNGTSSALQPALQAASYESYEVSPKAFAQYEVTGASLLASSLIEDTADGWRTWNGAPTKATLSATACPAGDCMTVTAGASDTILISPRFAITRNQWYRMSFDMKTQSAGQTVEFLVRRGGGGENGYESLMGPKGTVTGTGTWTRYALVFKADKTINIDDPVTGDLGARIDFGWLRPGTTIGVGNVEIVPISAVDEVTRLALLSNPDANEQWMNCPDIDSNPELCDRYVTFLDQSPVSWPHAVSAHSSEIIFTRNLDLVDSDEDGIADSQDACPATPDGREVNAAGCSL